MSNVTKIKDKETKEIVQQNSTIGYTVYIKGKKITIFAKTQEEAQKEINKLLKK